MPTLAELRSSLGQAGAALTDQDLYEVAMEAYGPMYSDPKHLQRELGYNPNQNFTRGLKIGGRGSLAAVAGMGALGADVVGATGARDSMLGYAQEQQQKAYQLGRRSDNFDNAGEDPLAFLAAGAGQAVAFAAPSLLSGGVGALAARGLGMRALAGAAAGSYGANLSQEAGGIYNDLAEQGRYEPGRALAYGAGAAVLDTASEAVPFLRPALKGGLAKRIGKSMAYQAGTEAGTEAGQTAIERAGAYKELGGDEAWSDYRNAAALGAIGGGMFGGVTGGLPGKRAPKPVAEPGERTDLLNGTDQWTLTQGFDARQPAPAPASPLGDLTPDWSTSPGVGLPTQPGLDAAGLYRAADEPPMLGATGRRGASPLSDMPSVDLPMVADEAGTVGVGQAQGDALYGREDGDPGLALARERYMAQRQQQDSALATKQAIDAAAAAHAEKRTRAHDNLLDRNPDGSYPIRLTPQDVKLYSDMEELKAAGRLQDDAFNTLAGEIKVALQSDDKKAVNHVRKTVEGLKNAPNPAGNGGPQPDLAGRGDGGQQLRVQGPVALQPDAAPAAAQAVGSVEPAGVRPGTAGGADALIGGKNTAAALVKAQKAAGRELSPAETRLATALATLAPRDAGIVRDALGWDAEGHQVNEPLSYEQIGQKYQTRGGKAMSRQGVQAVLKKVGITEQVLDALRAESLPTVDVEELGLTTSGEDGAPTGMRVSTKAGAGADDFVLDAKTVKAQQATDAAIQAAGPEANAEVDTKLSTVQAWKDGEFEQKRAALAKAAAEREAGRSPARPRTVREILAPDLARNDLAEVDIEDAAAEWDSTADPEHNEPKFAALQPETQAAVVRSYRNDQLTARRQNELLDQDDQLAGQRKRNADSAGTGGAGGREAPALGNEAGAASSGRPTQGSAQQGAPTGVARDKPRAQFSKGPAQDSDSSSVEKVKAEIEALMPVNYRRVQIVQSIDDIPAEVQESVGANDQTQAFVIDGKAYLIADNIDPGTARAVFMHEVGAHLGMEHLLTEDQYDTLTDKILEWAGRTDGSIEQRLAVKALERVHSANTPDEQANSEMVAYFIEEAINAGIDPKAVRGELGTWFRTMWAAFKQAMRRLGIANVDNLTAQDLVDLAYGAAKLSMDARFHGTAANVHKFQTKYMGTGEGAQAFGWGLYFSESRRIAEEYKKADERRKTPPTVIDYGTFDRAGFPGPGRDVGLSLANDLFKNAKGDFDAAREALREKEERDSHRRHSIYHVQNHEAALRALNEMETGGARLVSGGRPRGNLYATDFNVKPDEWLSWNDTLDAHSTKVKQALERVKSVLSAPSWADVQSAVDDTRGMVRELYDDAASRDAARTVVNIIESNALTLEQLFRPGFDAEVVQWYEARDRGNADIDLAGIVDDMLSSIRASAEVAGEIRAKDALSTNTGGMLYHALEQMAQTESGPFASKSKASPAERASRYLDSIGIKGIKYPINATTGGTGAKGYNFVVFDERNVVKIAQFSQRATPQAVSRLEAAEAQISARLSAPAKGAWTNTRDAVRKFAPYLMTTFQLVEQFGDRVASLKKYMHAANLMRVEATAQQMVFDEVAKRWNTLPTAEIERLNQVALRATLQETHPDVPVGHESNAHLTDAQRAGHAALAAQYRALTPAAQKVYQDAKKALADSRERMVAAVQKLQDDYGITRSVPDKTPGPYFPLLRFGDYLAIGESSAFKDLAAQLPGLEGEARAAMQKRITEMKRDRAHYRVSAHQTRAEMEATVAQYKTDGLDAKSSMADQHVGRQLPSDIHKLVNEMAVKMAGSFDGETATSVINAYTEMLMKSLPELSALHRQAQRVGVEGASQDMLRAFASTGRQNAFHTSRLLHAKPAAEAIVEMRGETKGNTDMEHVFREMEKRAALNLQFLDTPVQDLVSRAGHVWYLAASPTYLLMNSMQPWLVTGPVLAGKYGFAKATKALAQASKEALMVMRDARWKDGKWSPWEGIHEDSIPGKSVSEDRKALRELMKRGVVDEGLTHEMSQFAAGENGKLSKFVRGMGWFSQQVELTNRVATALATFRLARAEGLDYDAAVDEAYRGTVNTQMDYSQENTARVMREGGGVPFAKLIFQFRRYQQAMLYLLLSNINKLTNQAERKTAGSTLAYFAVTSALSAGVLGMPFIGTALAIANLLRDDDDEDGDAETVLRNALVDLTGDKGFATTIAKGLPAAFGVDLSKRLGLGQIAQPYPNADWSGKTGQDVVGRVLTSIAGPGVGGLGSQALDAASYFSNGDYAKGTEKLLPKIAADVMRAGRMATQGMTDRKGEEILGPDEISAWNLVVRSMGAASTLESNYYEGTKAKKDLQGAIETRKGRIGNKFRAALANGDLEDVRQEIAEFNDDHPDHAIKPKDEIAWRRASQRSAGQRDGTGIKVDARRDRGYEDVMRFAR